MLSRAGKQTVIGELKKAARNIGATFDFKQVGNRVMASVTLPGETTPRICEVGIPSQKNTKAAYVAAESALCLGSKKAVRIDIDQQPEISRQRNFRQPMPQYIG